jgi:hypothetical protein
MRRFYKYTLCILEQLSTHKSALAPRAVKLALDILHQKPIPPAMYAPVQLMTPKNVDQFYPKDLFGQSDIDLALR